MSWLWSTMMAERYASHYTVGYKRPPDHTRFKKGRSGNPRGRSDERLSVTRIMAEELQASIYISEGGKRRKVEKIRVLCKQAINQAMAGKNRQLESMIRLLSTLEQINKTPTRKRPRKSILDGIDIDKLSTEELIKLQREVIANSRPLDEM
jgi:hypothetical protein